MDVYVFCVICLRLGVLLVPQDDPAVPTGENPGYSLAKAFSYINQTATAKKALYWLITVSINVPIFLHTNIHATTFK